MILWTMKPPTDCSCAAILSNKPSISQAGGHLAAPLSELFPTSSVLHKIANASAKDSYFPRTIVYRQHYAQVQTLDGPSQNHLYP